MLAATAAEAGTLYGITFDDDLITIDTATGAGTLVGKVGNPFPFLPRAAALDLAAYNGNLYIWNQTAGRLQLISQTNAMVLQTIDLGSIVGGAEGGFTFSASGNGFLGLASGSDGRMYTMTTAANSAALLTANTKPFDGLAFSAGGTLYGISQGAYDGGSKLYTVNTANGSATLVGATGVGTQALLGGLSFALDGRLFLALADDATLASYLYSVDPATGLATLIGNIGFNGVSGIAFVESVPEPSTVALLVSSAMVLGWRRRKRL